MVPVMRSQVDIAESPREPGIFDLVRVQNVCEDIMRALLGETRPEQRLSKEDSNANREYEIPVQGTIRYQNCVGDFVLPMDESMGSVLAEEKLTAGGSHVNMEVSQAYASMPMANWLQSAIAAGMHPAVAALIETLNEEGGGAWPRFQK